MERHQPWQREPAKQGRRNLRKEQEWKWRKWDSWEGRLWGGRWCKEHLCWRWERRAHIAWRCPKTLRPVGLQGPMPRPSPHSESAPKSPHTPLPLSQHPSHVSVEPPSFYALLLDSLRISKLHASSLCRTTILPEIWWVWHRVEGLKKELECEVLVSSSHSSSSHTLLPNSTKSRAILSSLTCIFVPSLI